MLFLLSLASLLGLGVVWSSLCIPDCESVVRDGKLSRVSDRAGAG